MPTSMKEKTRPTILAADPRSVFGMFIGGDSFDDVTIALLAAYVFESRARAFGPRYHATGGGLVDDECGF
jgi:hypothetical protein